MRRCPAGLIAVIGAIGVGTAALASAASLTVHSDHLDAFDLAGPTTSTTEPTPGDTTPPALTALEAFDANGNGKIDRVIASFGEDLADYTVDPSTTGWTVANVPSGGTLASVARTATRQVTLTFAEDVNGTPSTAIPAGFTVALAATNDGVRDGAGNTSSFAATTPADKAAPARLSLEMEDVNANGWVDRLSATFSEDLVNFGTPAGIYGWSGTDVPSGGAIGNAQRHATNARVVRVAVTEGAGAASTAVGSFKVTLTANDDGVRDAAGNISSFTATSPTDKAAPIPIGLATANSVQIRRLDRGDTVSITFSEILDEATICSAWTSGTVGSQAVTADNALRARVTADGAVSDTVAVEDGTAAGTPCPTLQFGTIGVDARYHVSGTTFSGGSQGTVATTITWTPSTRVLRLQFGTPSNEGFRFAENPAPNPAVANTTYVATNAGITDPAGNAAAGVISGTTNF